MSDFEEIKKAWEYFAKIYAPSAKGKSEEDKKFSEKDVVEKLCDIALETRRFEIELYWKRTTYYWAFIAAGLAAYGLVYTKKCPTTETYLIMMLLALCGLVFSVGWFLANKGSKYWQENWEAHMGLLVTKHYGPIFKYLYYPSRKRLLQGMPYSVSKINQVISGFVGVVWGLLFIYPCYKVFCSDDLIANNKIIIAIILIVLGVLFIWILITKTKSGHYTRYCKWKEGKQTEDRQDTLFFTDYKSPKSKK